MTAYTQNCSRSIAGHPAGVLDILAEILCVWMKNQGLKYQLAVWARFMGSWHFQRVGRALRP